MRRCTKSIAVDHDLLSRRRLDPVQTIPLGVDVPLKVAQPRLGLVELEAAKNPLLPGPGPTVYRSIGTQRARRPFRPELAPLGVWPSSQLAWCAGGRAGWRLSGDVAVLPCCTSPASSARAPPA